MSEKPAPIAADSPARARIRVAAAVVWQDGKLLLTQRPPKGPLGLQWEMPGGKIEAGETPERALVREVYEELGVRATPFEVLRVERHDYPHGLEIEITFVRCTFDSHDFRPNAEVHAFRWVAPGAIDLSEVLAADRDFLIGLGARA
jgi:8-oxo-dGTP diphosphatase